MPHVSIVIPIFNEEAILESAVASLVERLQSFSWSYELVLAENGSRDNTVALASALRERFAQVNSFSVNEPNYGKALREGILRATGDIVICDEIDLCDTDFYERALLLLESNQADLVIGSKAMAGANDERPLVRRAGTLVINLLLRWTLGFSGTDTHGLKAFKRESLVPIANQCIVEKDLFASEFVIRAERAGVRVREIPVRISEKRPPSIRLFSRVPNVLKNLVRLIVAIRIRGEHDTKAS